MFQIDVMSREPVYEQLINQVENFILTGILKSGDKIPSVRSLAVELSVNPNTIQKAYSELDRRGIIYSVPGRGCFINEEATNILNEHKRQKLSELEDFIYELALADITKDELLKCIDNAFKKKEGMIND